MKLGIMQPYFFPYLGYFDLIARTDKWVVFDIVQYSPKSWMNRNRILHPAAGWQYVSVPVDRHSGSRRICDIRMVDPEAARQKILAQMAHYRTARAPHYLRVTDLVDNCFRGIESDLLRDLNVRSLCVVCDYLGLRFDYSILSESGLVLPDIQHAGQWALEIAGALGAREYVNLPSGKDIFVPAEWDRRDIALTFTDLVEFSYSCGRFEFVERLSILDVLMWNDAQTIRAYLESRGGPGSLSGFPMK